MCKKSALIFVLALSAPAIAWACPSGFIQLVPMDFIVLGVTAAVGYRLFLQWTLRLSDQMNSAIYLSFLIASFGVGVLVTGEVSIWPGFLGFIGLFLALFGALYPKHWFARLVYLGPIFAIAAGGSLMVLESHSNAKAALPIHEMDERALQEVVF